MKYIILNFIYKDIEKYKYYILVKKITIEKELLISV